MDTAQDSIHEDTILITASASNECADVSVSFLIMLRSHYKDGTHYYLWLKYRKKVYLWKQCLIALALAKAVKVKVQYRFNSTSSIPGVFNHNLNLVVNEQCRKAAFANDSQTWTLYREQ